MMQMSGSNDSKGATVTLTRRLLTSTPHVCIMLMGVVRAAHGSAGNGGSAAILLLDVTLVIALACWVRNDSINRSQSFLKVSDYGFFLFLAWPIVMPFYLVRTRGLWRTLLIVCIFVGCYVLGTIATKWI